MWKVVFLGLYTVLAVRGLANGAPFQPEEKWKPLDNPRNRDLITIPEEQQSGIRTTILEERELERKPERAKEEETLINILDMTGYDMEHPIGIPKHQTLQAYFSGRGLDLRKFPATFTMNNEGPRPVMFYSDPIASAFADYEERRNSFPNYFKG